MNRNIIKLLFLVLLITNCRNANAQTLYAATLPNSTTQVSSYPVSMVSTKDGGFMYLANVGSGTDQDILIYKTNSDGSIAWQRIYGQNNGMQDQASKIIATSDGYYVFAGTTYIFDPNNLTTMARSEGFIQKVDINGIDQWSNPTIIVSNLNVPGSSTIAPLYYPINNGIASGERVNSICEVDDGSSINIAVVGTIYWEEDYSGQSWQDGFISEIYSGGILGGTLIWSNELNMNNKLIGGGSFDQIQQDEFIGVSYDASNNQIIATGDITIDKPTGNYLYSFICTFDSKTGSFGKSNWANMYHCTITPNKNSTINNLVNEWVLNSQVINKNMYCTVLNTNDFTGTNPNSQCALSILTIDPLTGNIKANNRIDVTPPSGIDYNYTQGFTYLKQNSKNNNQTDLYIVVTPSTDYNSYISQNGTLAWNTYLIPDYYNGTSIVNSTNTSVNGAYGWINSRGNGSSMIFSNLVPDNNSLWLDLYGTVTNDPSPQLSSGISAAMNLSMKINDGSQNVSCVSQNTSDINMTTITGTIKKNISSFLGVSDETYITIGPSKLNYSDTYIDPIVYCTPCTNTTTLDPIVLSYPSCSKNVLTIDAKPDQNQSTFTWTEGSVIVSNQNPAIINNPTQGSHTYTVKTSNSNCPIIVSHDITVDIPNLFCEEYVKCTEGTKEITDIRSNDGVFQGSVYNIPGSITIASGSTVKFAEAEFIMGYMAKITVQKDATLIIQGSHLYGCPNMWQGIEVEPGGVVQITGTEKHSSFIEDAIVAVHFDFNSLDNLKTPKTEYFLNVDNTIFNKNNISIEIENYYSNFQRDEIRVYPFYVKNAVFTSRDIQFNKGSLDWDDVEMVKDLHCIFGMHYPTTPDGMSGPYIDKNRYPSNTPEAFMKSPFYGLKPYAGIVLKNAGNNDRNASSLSGFKIGYSQSEHEVTDQEIKNNEAVKGQTYNTIIFDNITEYGITAISSNLTVVNCTFQNAYNQPVPDGDDYRDSYQIGIYAGHNKNNELYNLNVIREKGELPTNAFFNQVYAVKSDMCFINTISDADIRSTQQMTNDNTPGQFGIYIQTKELGSVEMNYNRINNIYSPITLFSNIGFNQGYDGPINVVGNTIGGDCPKFSGKDDCTGKEGVNIAIELATGYAGKVLKSANYVNCNNNNISGAYNGIKLSNWKYKTTITDYNVINLVENYNNGMIGQFGIRAEGGFLNRKYNGSDNEINHNIIKATGSDINASGIEMDINSNCRVNCNKVFGGLHAFHFVGHNAGTEFRNNIIDESNTNGLTLDNLGYIGDQGTYDPDNPDNDCSSDNQWVGTWDQTLGNYKTYCIGSDATASPLNVSVSGGVYDPYQFNPNSSGYPYNLTNGSINYVTNGVSCSNCATETGRQKAAGTMAARMVNKSINSTAKVNSHTAKARGGNYNGLSYNEQIALGVLPIQGKDSAQQLYVLQQELYNNLKSDTAEQNSSFVLQVFEYSTDFSNIGQFYVLDSILSVKDTMAAMQFLPAIQPANPVDEHYIAYYNWMLNIERGIGVLPQDTAAIFNLATGCPSIDGMVVFAARNLYNNITKKVYSFVDVCGAKMANRMKNTKFAITKTITEGIKVFPNPTRGDVNIVFPNGDKGCKKIIVNDVFGKTVLEKETIVSDSKVSINIKSTNGIYFLNIIDCKTGSKEVKKLILQQ